MRRFILTEQHRELLYLIQKGLRMPLILRQIGTSKQLLNYRLKMLVKKGYLILEVRDLETHYMLTSKGNTAIFSFTYAKPLPEPIPTHTVDSGEPGESIKQSEQAQQQPEPTIRPNGFNVKFPLVGRLPKGYASQVLEFEDMFSKPLSLKNQDGGYFRGKYSGLLTDTSLMIFSEDMEVPLGADYWLVVKDSISAVFKAASELEPQLGVKLRRQRKGLLVGEVTRNEIALKNHQIAKDAKDNNSKLYCYDPDTMELIIITDFSHGFPEWEAVNKRSAAYNADEMVKASTFMGTGRFREWTQRVEDLNRETSGLLNDYGHQLNLHLPVLEKMDKVEADQLVLNEATAKLQAQQSALNEKQSVINEKLDRVLTELMPKPRRGFWDRMFKRS